MRNGQTVTLPDELAAVLADEDSPPGVSPVFRFPYAAEGGLASGPPAGVGVGGNEARRFAVPRHRPAFDQVGWLARRGPGGGAAGHARVTGWPR